MLLNEIINEVGMTKRAVKYYEEKRIAVRIKITMVIVTILHKMLKL